MVNRYYTRPWGAKKTPVLSLDIFWGYILSITNSSLKCVKPKHPVIHRSRKITISYCKGRRPDDWFYNLCYERQHYNSTRTTNTTLTHFCQDTVQSGNSIADLLIPRKPHGEKRSCTKPQAKTKNNDPNLNSTNA